MSILIKGMEMPKSCAKCKLFGEYGCAFIGAVGYALTEGRRNDDCPLFPVPPHGRLIDADAILNDKGMGTQIAGWGKMYHETVIEYAPTIIPAEE